MISTAKKTAAQHKKLNSHFSVIASEAVSTTASVLRPPLITSHYSSPRRKSIASISELKPTPTFAFDEVVPAPS